MTTASTTGRTSEETSLSLVWLENFGSGTLIESTAGEALAAVLAGEIDLFLLGEAGLLGIADHLPRERRGEAGVMRAAVALRDVVGEAEHGLVVAVVPRQRRLDDDFFALALDQQRIGNELLLVAVEIAHEFLDAAVVEHLLDARLGPAQVGERHLDAGIQERELAQPVLERREIEFGLGEDLVARRRR